MKMFIAGQWIDKEDKINVYDPYDNSIIDTVPRGSAEDLENAISSAVKGFEVSKKLPVHKRMDILEKTAAYIQNNLDEFATIIAKEGSKTIREARKEARRCVNTLKVAAEEARRILGETIPFDSFPGAENKVGYYYRFPIGVIACITPFNDPLNLVAHKIGPAIAGGNSVVLKPATVTPLSALKLVQVLLDNGLPPETINCITGYGSEIGDNIASDPRIRMISFTGGVEAGKRIASLAGLKKIGMELGSNTGVIVWKDARLDNAVASTVSGSFWAAGQNCIGVQRIFIHEDIYDAFKEKFVAKTKSYKLGNKLDESTDMGPMITEAEAKRTEEWVKDAVSKGATLLAGGNRTGALFEPTILEHVTQDMKVDCEEAFAPVVNFYKVSSLDQAIKEVNKVDFGLQTAIFTQDMDVAFQAVHQLDCGGVIVNDADYRLDSMPFGGVKNSGLGREGLKFALQEMTEPKVVCFSLEKSPL